VIVAITGHRKLSPADAALVTARVEALIYDVRPAAVIFGGAVGVDTVALAAAQHHRSYGGHTVRAHRSRLVVIVPDVVRAQPHEAREAIRLYADDVVETRNAITSADGWAAYRLRNEAMVNRADVVLAFWDGDTRTGTGSCVAYAARMGREVWVETIGGAR
jgi:hypothetical protein